MAKSTYSWEDFLKELDGSGLRDQFSDADLKLAQANPDIGMSLLGYKRQYNGTEDKAERARLNNAANALRSSYGGYTGGANGASFLKDPLAPRDFSYKEAPTYQNRYDGRIQELLDAVTNRGDFSYDAEKDPLFSQYRKQYIREGQRASADAMGQAAAMSGGLPSSFAGTAAGQAANYYNAQLTDKIPELEELAYQKYLNAFDMDRAKLSAVQNAEQSDYQKFLNELGQYNSDRSFAYGQFSDQLSREQGDRDAAEERRRYENETAYQREQDDRDRKLAEAQLYAQYGDLSGLKALGVDTSKYEAQLAAANTPRTVYSGSGSGSGSSASSASSEGKNQDYDGLFAKAMESNNPESFISNNYKNFGFTSSTGLYRDYLRWAEGENEKEEAEANRITDMSQLGGEARRLLNGFARGYTNLESAANTVQREYEQGKITEAEARYLLERLGAESEV